MCWNDFVPGQGLDKAENGKFKVNLRSNFVAAVLELCKVLHSGIINCALLCAGTSLLWYVNLHMLMESMNAFTGILCFLVIESWMHFRVKCIIIIIISERKHIPIYIYEKKFNHFYVLLFWPVIILYLILALIVWDMYLFC